MPVTDQTVLSEIQRVTLENAGDGGATWPSGMWTQAEVLSYLNQRQNRFLLETGIRWTHAEVAVTAAQSNQAAPTDWIATILLAYKSAAGLYRELPRMDALELDLEVASWPGASSATPRGYYETDGDTLTTYIAPIPTEVGAALERYYVALGTTLTAAGVNFSVPDEFVPTIKYGCLAEMFLKLGPGAQNLVLVELCEARWQEGVEMGKLQAPDTWFVL
jgi:hypothetical protein